VFPQGDLALLEATRLVLHLSTRPNEKMMHAMAQDWAPWRAVAARLLWAYYKRHKLREVIA
jgi:DNA-3-methyladenine glycosylase II